MLLKIRSMKCKSYSMHPAHTINSQIRRQWHNVKRNQLITFRKHWFGVRLINTRQADDMNRRLKHTTSSLFVWLWLVVNDRKFPARTVFLSHTNQPVVLLHEPANRTGWRYGAFMAAAAHISLTLWASECMNKTNLTWVAVPVPLGGRALSRYSDRQGVTKENV